jgi:DNA-binding NtrC family response regulator
VGDGLKILVADDDPQITELLRRALATHQVATAQSGADALRLIRSASFEVVLLDLRMPDMDGLDVLKAIKGGGIETAVVMMTGFADVDSAVTAMKLGAHDYLRKPLDLAVLERVLIRTGELQRRKAAAKAPGPPAGRGGREPKLLGVDSQVLALRTAIERAAPTESTVLITGETGTGKELVARMIHAGSSRSHRPFVVVDCPSVPVLLFESEVFGHERGAFTGAVARRRGKLEEADGGTLFLDEIGDLTPEVQPKLLRFLQERRVAPVGSNRVVNIDARVISASNRELGAMVDEGLFRADLFHRLNVVHIHLPPLRERKGDIPLLVAHCVDRFCRQAGVSGKIVSADCLALLVAYDWPGNVRELENTIEQACVLTPGHTITPESLPPRLSWRSGAPDRGGGSQARSLAEVNEDHVLEILRQEQWNISSAARVLGIHRATLYRRLLALGLRPDRVRDKHSS